jgi:hypothetical protein
MLLENNVSIAFADRRELYTVPSLNSCAFPLQFTRNGENKKNSQRDLQLSRIPTHTTTVYE